MEQSCLNCCTVHPSHFVSLKKVLTVTHKLFKYLYTTNTTPGTSTRHLPRSCELLMIFTNH